MTDLIPDGRSSYTGAEYQTVSSQGTIQHSSAYEGGDSDVIRSADFFALCGSKEEAGKWQVITGSQHTPLKYSTQKLTGEAQLSRRLSFEYSHMTVALRFRIHIVNFWASQTCWVKANGRTVFETALFGDDKSQDCEVQIPDSHAALELTFGCNLQSSLNIQWRVSDVVVHANKCSVRYVYNEATGSCVMAGDSIFAGLVSTGYGSLRQTQYQPAWLSKVTVGETQVDIIAVSEQPAGLATTGVPTTATDVEDSNILSAAAPSIGGSCQSVANYW